MKKKLYIAPAMQTLSIAPTQLLCESSISLSSGSNKSGDAKGRGSYYDEDDYYDEDNSYGGLW